MLRAGGVTEPIILEVQPRRSSRQTREFYKLHQDSVARIKDLIENVFMDKEKGE
jgi:hypothetical protein